MKRKAVWSFAMVLAYGLFLVFHAPARLIANHLPPDVSIDNVSGTLWRGSVQQLHWKTLKLDEVRWTITMSSLMPALQLNIQNPEGIQGRGMIRGWQRAQLYQWQLSVPAGYLLRFIPLMVPVNAEGNLQLNLRQATLDRNGCQSLDATLNWPDAQVKTPLGGILLATPQAILRCQQGGIEAELQQMSSHLQFSGKGRVSPQGEYQFNGQLTSGEGLPETIKKLLTKIGKTDAKGVSTVNIQGRFPQ